MDKMAPTSCRVGTAVVIGVASIVGYLILQNQRHYGVSQLDSFSAGFFPVALNKWASMKSDDSRNYRLVNASPRKPLFAISSIAKT